MISAMCSIAGVLTNAAREKLFVDMQSILKHWGSYDDGVEHSSRKMLAQVCTRLSVIYLSSAGHQPMGVVCSCLLLGKISILGCVPRIGNCIAAYGGL